MQSLPILYIKAESHYEVGKAIGCTFKGWITEYLDTADDLVMLREFYNSPTGREIYEEYLESSNRCYPNIVSEIRGMADGCEQKFEDLFLLQITSEVTFCNYFEVFGKDFPQSNVVKGCTDILVNSKSARMIGHNDDWVDNVSERTYIVHVTIYDPVAGSNRDDVKIREEFVSYVYPGSLPGFCFGMNKDLVITLNTLTPKYANSKGVPVQVLLRQLLTCSTIEECVKVMENKPIGCAYGMAIHIAEINSPDMCTLEAYPREISTEVVVRRLSEGTPDSENFLHHQNHYKYVKEFVEVGVQGSKRRGNRVDELENPTTERDIRTILGDTKDELEPVFGTPDSRHLEANLKTSATAIFNIMERRLDVYRCNPRQNVKPCLTLPFF